MPHPHNSPVAYSGPGLIIKNEMGGDYADFDEMVIDLGRDNFEDFFCFWEEPDLSLSEDFTLDGHSVLAVDMDQDITATSAYREIPGVSKIWMRQMVRLSEDAEFLAPFGEGEDWNATLYFLGVSAFYDGGGNIYAGADIHDTLRWDIVDAEDAAGPLIADDVAAMKDDWVSQIILLDAAEGVARMWINGVLRQAARFTPGDPINVIEVTFGRNEGGSGDPEPSAAGLAYIGLYEFVAADDPYGLIPTDGNKGWRVTFFEDDDVTPLFGVGDGLGGVHIGDFYTGGQ